MRGSRGSQDLTNMHQGRNVEKRKRLQNARKRLSLLVSVPVSNIVKKKRKQTDLKKNEIFCLSVTVMRLGVTKALNMFLNQISIRSKFQYFGNFFTLLF